MSESIPELGNNQQLRERLLGKCTVPPPVRMGEIAATLANAPEAGLDDEAIAKAVNRIFELCRGENGRPLPAENTPQILENVVTMLVNLASDDRPSRHLDLSIHA